MIIPNADGLKSSVAGSSYISVGDLKEGFHQLNNELEISKRMAVLAASGCYLPRSPTFGPTHGLEAFQELVFMVFQKRLSTDWFAILAPLQMGGRRACPKVLRVLRTSRMLT